jgi:hypothetical protein
MILCTYKDFPGIKRELWYLLARGGEKIHVGEWQSIRDAHMVQSRTIELTNVVFEMNVPSSKEDLVEQVQPNLPFAEAQFQDRVSGEPLNPPPSDQLWPWAHHLDDDKQEGKYSHTYPERFWPKMAECGEENKIIRGGVGYWRQGPNAGIRFEYGDLQDVVTQLSRSPHTRQAYLPVWFPEDTGAVHGERVPCSLGYHFLLRNGRLNCTYFIRSVDFFRHFADDVYMAARLLQWVEEACYDLCIEAPNAWTEVYPGTLTMHIVSLHVFEAEHKRLMKGPSSV